MLWCLKMTLILQFVKGKEFVKGHCPFWVFERPRQVDQTLNLVCMFDAPRMTAPTHSSEFSVLVPALQKHAIWPIFGTFKPR
uniref:Secreted protein n=1 Tax=Helianthus annuus TaxID=4232 RepID=A0A251U875_HELAN